MKRALLAGLTSLLVVACEGPASHSGSDRAPAVDSAELAREKAAFEPFVPAFQSLEAALDARDDDLALRILARILAREPTGVALERAQAFERILEGRAWVATLDIGLDAERVEGTDQWIVSARAKHSGDVPLTLRGAPPILRTHLLGVSPNGLEQRYSRQTVIDALAVWRLAPGVDSKVEVARLEIPPGNALAVRAIFALEFLPGEIVREDVVRPATNLYAAHAEAVCLAKFLPTAPVEPEELARYVREQQIRTPPLLERAVRIPLAERSRALDLLTPGALELPSGELEKLVVALRWLSGESQLGADPRSWRQWLDERARAREAGAGAPRHSTGGLELPERRSYRH